MPRRRRAAIACPGHGQNTLFEGMAQTYWEDKRYSAFRSVFYMGLRVLEGDPNIVELSRFGKAEDFWWTTNAQPLSVAMNLGLAAQLRHNGERAFLSEDTVYTGHSLGLLSAGCLAGFYDEESTFRIAKERARLMHEVCGTNPNKWRMVALTNPSIPHIEDACARRDVDVVNYNGSHIVVAGSKKAVEKVVEEVIEKEWARRAVPLDVQGPYHARWMHPVVEQLRAYLETAPIASSGNCILIGNQGQVIETREDLIEELSEGTARPVRFDRVMDTLHREHRIKTPLECGSGKVLTDMFDAHRRLITSQRLKWGVAVGAAALLTTAVVTTVAVRRRGRQRKNEEQGPESE